MKFSKLSQLFLASGIGLTVAALISACQLVTIDYVYVAGQGSSSGAIDVFAADSQSGALRLVAGTDKTPFSTGGTTPVAMVTSPNYANLYVANSDNSTIVHFAIAANGALTKKDQITLSGKPVAMAVNASSSVLYVVYGSTSATLAAYPLSSGTIGSVAAQQTLTIPGYTGDLVAPTALTVLANGNAVYATVYDVSAYNPGGSVTSAANPGWIFGFATGSGGTLTPATSSPWRAGVKPSGIVADPTNSFVYVTDFASNHVIGYSIYSGNILQFLVTGPYKTGNQPTAIAIDPRGRFLYVTNSLDSSVSAYQIDLGTGIPSTTVNSTGSQTNSTDTDPVAVTVDPALGRFVYTANYLGNSISGFRLNPNTGTIAATQATPYPSVSKITAIVAVPHGNHSYQSITP